VQRTDTPQVAMRGFGDVNLQALENAITNPDSLISSITIRSKFLPPIVLNSPLVPDPTPSKFGPLAMPALDVAIAGISSPITLAPYGDPGTSGGYWPLIAIDCAT